MANRQVIILPAVIDNEAKPPGGIGEDRGFRARRSFYPASLRLSVFNDIGCTSRQFRGPDL
ncbi:hypothetical protein ES703_94983 [subsurface metagenome]